MNLKGQKRFCKASKKISTKIPISIFLHLMIQNETFELFSNTIKYVSGFAALQKS